MGRFRLYEERKTEFLDSMNSNQFKEVEKVFETMPKLLTLLA